MATQTASGLSVFPTIALELSETEALFNAAASEEQANAILSTIGERLAAQITQHGGIILHQRHHRLAFSIQDAPTFERALDKALRLTIALVQKEIKLQRFVLRLKAGVDLAQGGEETLLAAISEREAADTAQIVFSQRLYELCKNRLPFEVIGPLSSSNPPRCFYRLKYHQLLAQKEAEIPVVQNNTGDATDPSTLSSAPMDASEATALVSQFLLCDLRELPAVDLTISTDLPLETLDDSDALTPVFDVQRGVQKTPNLAYADTATRLYEKISSWTEYPGSPGRLLGLAMMPTMGKTTFLNMVRGQFPPEELIWVSGAFCQQHLSDDGIHLSPLGFWVDILFNLFGLPPEGMPHEMVDAHVGDVLQNIFPEGLPANAEALLKHLMALRLLPQGVVVDFDDVIGLFEEIFTYFSRKMPLVLAVEDVDAADPDSLRLLAGLLERDILSKNISLILTYPSMCTFSGEFGEALAANRLDELVPDGPTSDDLKAILQNPLATPVEKLPPAVQALYLETAMSSPMFIEESIRFLVNSGGFEFNQADNRFHANEKVLKSAVLPDSLDALLQLRFQQLPEDAQLVLQMASLVGHRVSHQLLASFAQDQDAFQETLNLLWEQGFLQPENQAVSQFRHQNLWYVVYESLLASERPQQHAMIYQMLEQAQGQITLHPNLLHLHAFKSRQADLMTHVLFERLQPWLEAVSATDGLAQLYLGLLQNEGVGPDDSSRKKEIFLLLGMTHLQRDPEAALPFLSQSFHHSNDMPEKRGLALKLAKIYAIAGWPKHQREFANWALTALRADATAHSEASRQAQAEVLSSLHMSGLYRAFMTQLATYTAADTVTALPLVVHYPLHVQTALLDALVYRGQPNTVAIIEGLSQVHGGENRALYCGLQLRLITLNMLKGDFSRVDTDLTRVLETIEGLATEDDLDAQSQLMLDWGLLRAQYLLATGQVMVLNQILPQLQGLADSLDDIVALGFARVYAVWAHTLRSPESADGDELLRIIEYAQSHDIHHVHLVAARLLGEMYYNAGHKDEAFSVLREAIALANRPDVDNIVESATLSASLARLLMSDGQAAEAGQVLEALWAPLAKTGYVPLLIDVADLIAQLYAQMAVTGQTPELIDKYRKNADVFQDKADALKAKIVLPS